MQHLQRCVDSLFCSPLSLSPSPSPSPSPPSASRFPSCSFMLSPDFLFVLFWRTETRQSCVFDVPPGSNPPDCIYVRLIFVLPFLPSFPLSSFALLPLASFPFLRSFFVCSLASSFLPSFALLPSLFRSSLRCSSQGTINQLDLSVTPIAPIPRARGIRNTVGFDWHPVTRDLWFTDNGRDQWNQSTPSASNDIPVCFSLFSLVTS